MNITALEVFQVTAPTSIFFCAVGTALLGFALMMWSEKRATPIWVGAVFFSLFVAGIISTGAATISCSNHWKRAKLIREVLSSPKAEIALALQREGGIEVTVKIPNETRQERILGQTQEVVVTPEKEVVLPPRLVKELERKNLQIAGQPLSRDILLARKAN